MHIYWEVDDEVVYSILRENIKDIEEFVSRFMSLISLPLEIKDIGQT